MESYDFFILGVISTAFLLIIINKRLKKNKYRKIVKRGQAAEDEAYRFLEKNGYKILDSQSEKKVHIYVNGEKKETFVKVDYLVEKNNTKYIVDVKTGRDIDPNRPHIRRQLLEYHLLFDNYDVILLDMENKLIKNVVFSESYFSSSKSPKSKKNKDRFFCAGLLFFIISIFFVLKEVIRWIP